MACICLSRSLTKSVLRWLLLLSLVLVTAESTTIFEFAGRKFARPLLKAVTNNLPKIEEALQREANTMTKGLPHNPNNLATKANEAIHEFASGVNPAMAGGKQPNVIHRFLLGAAEKTKTGSCIPNVCMRTFQATAACYAYEKVKTYAEGKLGEGIENTKNDIMACGRLIGSVMNADPQSMRVVLSSFMEVLMKIDPQATVDAIDRETKGNARAIAVGLFVAAVQTKNVMGAIRAIALIMGREKELMAIEKFAETASTNPLKAVAGISNRICGRGAVDDSDASLGLKGMETMCVTQQALEKAAQSVGVKLGQASNTANAPKGLGIGLPGRPSKPTCVPKSCVDSIQTKAACRIATAAAKHVATDITGSEVCGAVAGAIVSANPEALIFAAAKFNKAMHSDGDETVSPGKTKEGTMNNPAAEVGQLVTFASTGQWKESLKPFASVMGRDTEDLKIGEDILSKGKISPLNAAADLADTMCGRRSEARPPRLETEGVSCLNPNVLYKS